MYLEWNGMSKDQTDGQITGYAIDAGGLGYLRASIWMTRENAFLKYLFSKSWEKGKARCKFENYGELDSLGVKYLMTAYQGVELDSESKQSGVKLMEQLNALVGKGCDRVVANQKNDFRGSVTWLDSLYSFYELGMRLENEKKKPVVLISR